MRAIVQGLLIFGATSRLVFPSLLVVSHSGALWNFTHWTGAPNNLGQGRNLGIVPNPWCYDGIAMSTEPISTVPLVAWPVDISFLVGTNDRVDGMVLCSTGVRRAFGWNRNEANEDPGMLRRCSPDIFAHVPVAHVQRPGALISREVG